MATLKKTLEFATPGTRLSISLRQLVIERPGLPKATTLVRLPWLRRRLAEREMAAIRSRRFWSRPN
jgi:hypothetical protein